MSKVVKISFLGGSEKVLKTGNPKAVATKIQLALDAGVGKTMSLGSGGSFIVLAGIAAVSVEDESAAENDVISKLFGKQGRGVL